MKIKGQTIDQKGRCIHYHLTKDIIANRCGKCHQYYSCYQCHNELEKHLFIPIIIQEDAAVVLCGNCLQELSYKEYQNSLESGYCVFCMHKINQRCYVHHDIYFSLS